MYSVGTRFEYRKAIRYEEFLSFPQPPLGDINTEAWFSGMGVRRGDNNPTL